MQEFITTLDWKYNVLTYSQHLAQLHTTCPNGHIAAISCLSEINIL